jgi:methylated-DNA-protein-cysteine methyltransferase-like protein
MRKARKGIVLPRGTIRLHGDVQGDSKSAWEGVYRLARRIPKGRVMTYGQIAALLGSRLSPRAVGWAMHGCPRDVPWHRVVNASGGCSTDRLPDLAPGLQRSLLEREGVRFGAHDTLELECYRWNPKRRSRLARSQSRRRRI